MERFEIELLAEEEIPERVRAVTDFVAYFTDWVKPEEGNATGPIKSSRNPPSLQTPDAFQHILVQIAPHAKAVLAQFLVWYLNHRDMKIKVSKGTTTIEVPSGSVSYAQMLKCRKFSIQCKRSIKMGPSTRFQPNTGLKTSYEGFVHS